MVYIDNECMNAIIKNVWAILSDLFGELVSIFITGNTFIPVYSL